ncbi:MAG: tetratricopeptide repeat protein [Flavobacterium sp.]
MASNLHSQNLKDEKVKIDAASGGLKSAIEAFEKCLLAGDLDTCVNDLTRNGTDPYKKLVIAGILYDISPEAGLILCKEANTENPGEVHFTQLLAVSLHRNRDYKAATPLYEKYLQAEPKDTRVYAWLADCYVNIGEVKKASEYWAKLGFPTNHTSTDFAIHSIYNNENELLTKRDNYRKAIFAGDVNAAYNLIFLDFHWQKDWWNTVVQEIFLEEDLKLIDKLPAKYSKDVKFLKEYAVLKRSMKEKKDVASVKSFLINNGIVLNGKPLITKGTVLSDLVRMAMEEGIITAEDFYKQRGVEILSLAKKNKDVELLNLYAHLQAAADGKVDPAIDKLGWQQFKDERFVVSYFIGKAGANHYDDPELAQALTDFPESANLQWVKVNCAFIEKKNFKEELVQLIKKEFRSLKTDPNRYANALNSYFFLMAEEK